MANPNRGRGAHTNGRGASYAGAGRGGAGGGVLNVVASDGPSEPAAADGGEGVPQANGQANGFRGRGGFRGGPPRGGGQFAPRGGAGFAPRGRGGFNGDGGERGRGRGGFRGRARGGAAPQAS
jgi:hypothetical protein